MVSPAIPMSPMNHGLPAPSKMRPPPIGMSYAGGGAAPAGVEDVVAETRGQAAGAGGKAGQLEVAHVADGRALADSADHFTSVNPPQQAVQIFVLGGVVTHYGVLDADADFGIDQP